MEITPISNLYSCYRADKNVQNKREIKNSNVTTLPLFADAKSFVNITFKGEQELMRAIGNHYTDDFDRELATVENINYQDSDGDTPLTYAAMKNSLDFVEKLLAHPDIDVNIKNNDGRTALFIAARDGDKDVVAKLLEHPDTDPNCQTKKVITL
ncbi:ankyrin repeat domain-containing protein [bacterium]|nr:ankyrin repeat domain-containing protein [bacterium]